MVDYSKWDSMSISDSNYSSYESESEQSEYEGSLEQSMHFHKAYTIHQEFFQKHFKFEPKIRLKHQKIEFIHPIFFTDPQKFVPKDENGKLVCWGLKPYGIYEQYTFSKGAREGFRAPRMDLRSLNPPAQFISHLAKKKFQQVIRSRKENPRVLEPVDYIVEIRLDDTPFSRELKFSSSISLHLLSDKVLCPALGWVRNYKSYIYTCSDDGAQFGPQYSRSVDMVYLPLNGYTLIDDTKFKICDLLRKKGDVIYYTYDLAHNFQYTITLKEVKSPQNSNFKCKVISGCMGNIPQDIVEGNNAYLEFINNWNASNEKKRKKLMEKSLLGFNFIFKDKFDPHYFDLEQANADILLALDSPNSVVDGNKIICHPPRPNMKLPDTPQFRTLGKRFKEVITPYRNTGDFIKETVAVCDRHGFSLCFNCGNPDELMSCEGCRVAWYCGKQCQVEHWLKHRSRCRKWRFERKIMLEKLKKREDVGNCDHW